MELLVGASRRLVSKEIAPIPRRAEMCAVVSTAVFASSPSTRLDHHISADPVTSLVNRLLTNEKRLLGVLNPSTFSPTEDAALASSHSPALIPETI